MGFLLYLIVGGIIGWLAGLILGRDVPGGIIGNIIAGIIGAWIGGALFGNWGPAMAGIPIVPALIGAIVLVLVLSLIMGAMARGRR
ncbi:GlsB/YeaQ/YmgE family stress response membrane protein [Siminovitchia acidinfaciens]|uniref:GlsB/YeaQ/YmgE family stress response membrane protein n=1 Tax=Siminovitchia acidinfaciens TaxID=2321395 RepID=A0A429XWY0_9BACI|nr:GlsB/YeaQ/YmgE family stress response membrane protein [Siminovitchia acidinfaciens]RST73008.1 GlsB/YeaQ/YmgE family stress response membrane protein [Siminovitchia acidinfaciens]VEF48096.1 transglycosylase-associated protein [Bacillus freudenreichii]